MNRPLPRRFLPHTVTLYNQVSSGVYSAVILKSVYFEHCKKSNINKLGATNADSVLMVIDYVNTAVSARSGAQLTYIPAKEYAALTNKAGYWTLQDGAKDVFALGVTDKTLDGDINGVKAAYQTYVVRVVDTLYGAGSTKIHHFEVSGL